MNIEIETISANRTKIICSVTPEEVAAEREKAVKEFMSTATIPGFRKGKAPRQAIEKHFSSEISRETIRTTVNTYYDKAIKERELKVFETIDIADVKYDTDGDGGISFVATVDLDPEFELPKYEGIPVDNRNTEVTDEAVVKEFEGFRRSMARFEDFTPDHAAEADDMLCISYEGSIDGKPIAETYPESAHYGAKETSWCTVGSPYYIIPGMTEQLVGRKLGEEFTATVTFPDDFHKEEMRGATAEYKVEVKEGRHLAMPEVNEEFLKQLHVESADALKQRIREHMEAAAKEQDENRRIRQIEDYLLKSTPFEPPQAELERSTASALERLVNYGMRSGASKEELEKKRDELMKTARETADAHIRSDFIIAKIGREMNTTLSNEEFSEFLNRLFIRENMTKEQVKKIMQDNDHVRMLYNEGRKAKILRILLEKATPSDVIA